MSVINDDAIFSYIYRTLQSKLVHVQYTAQKATKLHHKMSAAAQEDKQLASGIVEFVNRMYSLEGRIKNKLPSLTAREKRYGRLFISLLDDLMKETVSIQKAVARSTNIMFVSAASLQVTVLKAVHYQWRERIFMSVLNKTNTIPGEDEHHCQLGRWYDGEGREKFGLMPAFIRLGEVHRKLHQVTAELAKEDWSHPDKMKLLEKLETFEEISLAVIAALDTLDDNIIRSGEVENMLPSDSQ
ncbi:CZB domain-containing protein [Salmonella enterica]|nr:CZB domain-containing protein [Salmonella enterica]EIK0388740.1 CZB domain-containing protein [Salmonella enterica]